MKVENTILLDTKNKKYTIYNFSDKQEVFLKCQTLTPTKREGKRVKDGR